MKSRRSGRKPKDDRMDGSGEMHGPYWLRAHKDWRFVAVVLLMLAAMLTYVMLRAHSWAPAMMPRG